jgi:glycerol-3-phosphate dehydrogenase (NAD(P)+)
VGQRTISEIIVIGAGNWGLTLACLFSQRIPTRVWTINAPTARYLNANRNNPSEFYKYPISESIAIEMKYSRSFDENRTLFIVAVPSNQIQSVATELHHHTSCPMILSVSKGFDIQDQCTISELITKTIPQASVAILTGPTIANEVAQGEPTRAVLASNDLLYLALLKEALANEVIFFKTSRHPEHHEICASLKGLVAIGIGIAQGLGLGANVQGILMVEGIRELAIVGSFFGVPESAAYGISGAGDLIATCISSHSRNRRLGELLAQGLTIEDATNKVGMTVEGLAMSKAIQTLWTLDVSIPLINLVNNILLGACCDIRQELVVLIKRLWDRP